MHQKILTGTHLSMDKEVSLFFFFFFSSAHMLGYSEKSNARSHFPKQPPHCSFWMLRSQGWTCLFYCTGTVFTTAPQICQIKSSHTILHISSTAVLLRVCMFPSVWSHGPALISWLPSQPCCVPQCLHLHHYLHLFSTYQGGITSCHLSSVST